MPRKTFRSPRHIRCLVPQLKCDTASRFAVRADLLLDLSPPQQLDTLVNLEMKALSLLAYLADSPAACLLYDMIVRVHSLIQIWNKEERQCGYQGASIARL